MVVIVATIAVFVSYSIDSDCQLFIYYVTRMRSMFETPCISTNRLSIIGNAYKPLDPST